MEVIGTPKFNDLSGSVNTFGNIVVNNIYSILCRGPSAALWGGETVEQRHMFPLTLEVLGNWTVASPKPQSYIV